MTEEEWFDWRNPQPLLDHLTDRASARKLRLFACACYRRVWPDPPLVYRDLVENAEKIAEGAERPPFDLDVEDYARGGTGSILVAPGAWEVADRVAGGAAAECQAAWQRDHPWDEYGVGYGAEQFHQANLLRDIFGNPFRPVVADPRWTAWNDSLVLKLARAIYDDRAFDRLPVLADALEDAGCADADILSHCRSGGEHVRGCWVLDLLLGKS